MKCSNCGETEAENVWGGVVVCQNCKRLADSLMRRNEQQFKAMLILASDKIRTLLIEGKLGGQHGKDSSSELRSDIQTEVHTLRERPEHRVDKGPRLREGNSTSPRW